MNILTDEEIFRCVPQEEDMMEFARTIEAEIMARLADKLKDADRYGWLIEQHWVQSEVDWRLASTRRESTIEQLGEAIDAVMKRERNERAD